ncbi:MAG TPA: NAD-dependent epimerase/dehydratase family protein, partial [Lysobacter sp.]
MRKALVFGASGQIGGALLQRLRAAGWQVAAVSRHAQPPLPGVDWLRGDLAAMPALPAGFDAIVSCGPLDGFARWYAASGIEAPRVVAFGSTSVATKHDSIDAAERDVARRLR